MPVLERRFPSLPIYNHSMKTQAVPGLTFLLVGFQTLGKVMVFCEYAVVGWVDRTVYHKKPSCFLK